MLCSSKKTLLLLILPAFLAACQKAEQPAPATTPPTPSPAPAATAPTPAPAGLPNFTRIVHEAGPAVVNISTTILPGQGAESGAAQAPADPLEQFFRQFMAPQPQQPQHSLGSGFIISNDGYILTNYHVVQGGTDIRVRLNDKRIFPAKVVGSDKLTDIALVKINASNLPVASLGNSDQVQVGAWVAAIGAPFGFANTVTQGIVSAEARYLPSENYVPFIQTDAPINPGNSGGPLLNLNGQVIGITSQIYSETGGYMGIGFAIPINVAMNVVKQLREHGQVIRGRIGVVIGDITPEIAKRLNLPNTNGALVAAVQPNSPGAQAGIQPRDVITQYNGHVLNQAEELPALVAQTQPGTKVPVQVIRNGKPMNLTVTVAELRPQDIQQPAPEQQQAPGQGVPGQ